MRVGLLAAPAVALLLALASPGPAWARDKPYSEGSVWRILMIRVKPGQFDTYMRDIMPLRKQIVEEAKTEGVILSEHILSGEAANEQDFDIVILDEYKNWAALDGLHDKLDAVEDKVGLTEEKSQQLMERRVEMRTIMGEKDFQELTPQ